MTATRPLVSVVIPIHNGERYLAQAIESVLAQTYSSFEIIAVDDGSTDAGAQIAQAYGPPVRYVHRVFHSTASARNLGAELANGAFLAFLDQDDVWLSDKLTLQMAVFEVLPDTEAVFGKVEQFRDSAADTPEIVSPPVQGYAPSIILIRKTAFWRIGPFDANLQLGEWVDWFARAQDLKLCMRELPHLVARRRVHAANKGFQKRAARGEYARALKASLDRRRAAGEL